MVYENNSRLIIMLCNNMERGRVKCSQYWPGVNQTLELGGLKINTTSEDKQEHLVIRKFNLEADNQVKEITQLNFTSWPDHGVPELANVKDTFTYMIEETDNYLQKYQGCPVITHCSAGVGRTGTFISFYNVYYLLKQGEKKLNIFNIVRKLKEQRLILVENEFQYKLIYSFLKAIVKK
jgi:protein tyrosine phosphatase